MLLVMDCPFPYCPSTEIVEAENLYAHLRRKHDMTHHQVDPVREHLPLICKLRANPLSLGPYGPEVLPVPPCLTAGELYSPG